MSWQLMRVSGHSMMPLLRPGDLVLVNRGAYRFRTPRAGEIVVARPRALGGKACIKRVIRADHLIELRGDHPDDSADSRTFGAVTPQELVGSVPLAVWPWRRLSPA